MKPYPKNDKELDDPLMTEEDRLKYLVSDGPNGPRCPAGQPDKLWDMNLALSWNAPPTTTSLDHW
ncbi:MAG: hypothetical protein LBS60_06595 [Deltaproteobacteria bacterium]|jgi:hypothetical protein|nr:hypothetical protein [Deltaproteobacteria bacterium]